MTDNDQKSSPSERKNSLALWGLWLVEAVHGALVQWIEPQQQVDPSDPAFTVLDEIEDELPPASAVTDGREGSDLVEEWHGSDESFTLADDPPTES